MDIVHTDRALARRLLRGDETGFRGISASFIPKLYRFALACLHDDEDGARDVAQETFRKAFERLDSYRAETSLYRWMCQICRNTITDRGRGLQRQAALRRMDVMRLIQATLDCIPAHCEDVLE